LRINITYLREVLKLTIFPKKEYSKNNCHSELESVKSYIAEVAKDSSKYTTLRCTRFAELPYLNKLSLVKLGKIEIFCRLLE